MSIRNLRSRLSQEPRVVTGLVILCAVVLLVLLAPLDRWQPDATDYTRLNQLPSGSHWFGTDYLGRDMLSRVLSAARISLSVGLGVVALEAAIGIPLGLLAGYYGRIVEAVVMRVVDVQLALPGLLLPLGITAVLRPSIASLIVALGVSGSAGYARLARGMSAAAVHQDYVTVARALGPPDRRIVCRHILPNIAGPLTVQITLSYGGAILAASALSYLGLGIQPPAADWGALVSSGYDHMYQAWSELAFPVGAICLTLLGITLLGDGLSDVWNPRL